MLTHMSRTSETVSTKVIEALIPSAFEIVQRNAQALATKGDVSAQIAVRRGNLAISNLCEIASDAFTRAAHEAGIAAIRECTQAHCFTGFGSPDEPPMDSDLIACMTWKQWDWIDHDRALEGPDVYIGPRRDIRQIVGANYTNYAGERLILRQVTHRPMLDGGAHQWLATTTANLLGGDFPIGLAPSNYSPPAGVSWEDL